MQVKTVEGKVARIVEDRQKRIEGLVIPDQVQHYINARKELAAVQASIPKEMQQPPRLSQELAAISEGFSAEVAKYYGLKYAAELDSYLKVVHKTLKGPPPKRTWRR